MVSGSHGLRVLADPGAMWRRSGASRAVLVAYLWHLGASWTALGTILPGPGASWRLLGPSWAQLGGLWSRLGGVLGALGASWTQLGGLLGLLGGVLGASWAVLGATWRPLGPSWRLLGSFLARRSRALQNSPPLGGILGGEKRHRSMYFTILSACRRVRSKKGS